VCLLQGPTFVRNLRPPQSIGVDFFQEWASARNLLNGLPAYENQRAAIERYLGYRTGTGDGREVEVSYEQNAHPPTSVLLAVPFALLDYPDAVLVWNLLSLGALFASLWLVGRELGITATAWAVFPAVTLLLLCSPFRQQMNQGQLNLVLLLLLTGTWVAWRSGRPGLSGVLLGAATALKVFPGFLFLFFALRREGKVLASGVLSFVTLSLLTVTLLGTDAYRTYVTEVVPQVSEYRSGWINASVPGVWAKLFDPATEREHVVAFWRSPLLARAGTVVSCLVIVLVLARAIGKARTASECDDAFGLTLTAMLLVSPITWDHYFLLLLLPVTFLWLRLPRSAAARGLFLLLLAALCVEPALLYNAFIPGGYGHGPAMPWHTMTVLSLHCYALLGLFTFGLAVLQARPGEAVLPGEERTASWAPQNARRTS
jgi:hypothetical protein